MFDSLITVLKTVFRNKFTLFSNQFLIQNPLIFENVPKFEKTKIIKRFFFLNVWFKYLEDKLFKKYEESNDTSVIYINYYSIQ